MEYASILLIPLIHELGHWLAALAFGSRLFDETEVSRCSSAV